MRQEIVGRIGCTGERGVYIVPIAFAYDGTFVYCYSSDGEKLKNMRTNPSVCFEVDRVDDVTHWRSVIAWGTFEELDEPASSDAVERLSRRLRAYAPSENVRAMQSYVFRAGEYGVAYRIRLHEKRGRSEQA